ncbi:MAG: hypothetical protein QXO30_01390 [Candidatus Caldarchaeum sp.]
MHVFDYLVGRVYGLFMDGARLMWSGVGWRKPFQPTCLKHRREAAIITHYQSSDTAMTFGVAGRA